MATRLIELVLHGDASQAIGEMEHLATATSASADTMHAKISNMASKITLATAAAGIGIVAVSVGLADNFEKAHAQLENSLKNTGQNFEQLAPAIQKADDAGQKFGYNQTQIEGLLAKGNAALGSNSKATQALQMAEDLSAKTGKDLGGSYLLATKALEGQLGPLKRAGIDLPIAAGGAAKLQTAQDQLAKASEAGRLVEEKVADGRLKGQAAIDAERGAYEKIAAAQKKVSDVQGAGTAIADAWNSKFGGSAAASAETFSGKVKALQADLENIGIKIGQAVIPIIEQLVGVMSDVIGWFEKNEGAAKALGIIIGTVLAGALAIFTYDKAVAFIGGLQRIGTALGIMGGETTAAAGEVEQLSLGFGGAETAGAGAAGGIGALLNPVTLIGGALLGAAYAAGYFNDGLDQLGITAGNLASQSVTQLSGEFQKLNADYISQINSSAQYTGGLKSEQAEEGRSAAKKAAVAKEQQNFNDILDKSPQYAQKFILAVAESGQNTDWFTGKLQAHTIAAEDAKNAQQRFGLQTQIAEAQARGDTDAVDRLTYQMLLIPSDKQVAITVHHEDAMAALAAVAGAIGAIPRSVDVAINAVGNYVKGP